VWDIFGTLSAGATLILPEAGTVTATVTRADNEFTYDVDLVSPSSASVCAACPIVTPSEAELGAFAGLSELVFQLYVVDGEIVVDLSDRVLTYTVDGVEVLRTEAGIGSVHNQTPTGEFFVTDNVSVADPNGPWGPHALGLSARSDTITEFNGGDGIIGIHGTNNPSSLGDDISLGCVRLANDVIATLHEMVPIGTRVTIQD